MRNTRDHKVRNILVLVALILLLFPKFMEIAGFREPVSGIQQTTQQTAQQSVTFRSAKLREEHYEKHGVEMGFSTPEEYEQAAAAVVLNEESFHKTEAEDGDDVYYLEKTNEFVIVSTDGYLRTYFYPTDGIDYFHRQ